MTRDQIEDAIRRLSFPIQARDEDYVEIHQDVAAIALACLRDYTTRDEREQAVVVRLDVG